MPHLITVLFCPYKTMSSGYNKHRVKVIFSFGNPLLLFFSYRTLMGYRQLHAEVELKSPADKFWGSIRDSTSVFPKAFPQDYKSIEVLEGDGKAPGSVRLITYSDGSPIVKVSKEKIDAVDDAERWVAYSVIDGDLLKYYKVFKGRIYVIPMGEGSLVKWSCEFEKASEEIPDPNIIKEFAVKNFKELDAFVLQA